MLSNGLVRSLCPCADENRYSLSLEEARAVLDANSEFSQDGGVLEAFKRYRATHVRSDIAVARELSGSTLELACGTGYLARVLFPRIAPKSMTYHCDISSQQLSSFHLNNREPHLRIPVQCSIDDLPFSTCSFDVVIGNSFLHHLPNVPGALSSICRVLRPDGVLVLLHEPSETANFFESFPIPLIRGVRGTPSLTDIWIFDSSKIEALLMDLGFKEVNIYGVKLIYSVFFLPFQIIFRKLGLCRLAESAVFDWLEAFSIQVERRLQWLRWYRRVAPSLIVTAKREKIVSE